MKMRTFVSFLSLLPLLLACGCVQRPVAASHWSDNRTIYELNTRQFTAEGTFAAAEAHLPRLKELGVGIVWFMPIQPIGVENRKGDLGSYYAIRDYTAVNPEFGTMDDFRSFVDKAHSLDIKVILDWVANHTSPDAVWMADKSWYVLDSLGKPVAPYDWTDVAKLDYGNPDMRRAMVEAMDYWLREADIDGFRCDVAGELPTDFWEQAVPELRKTRPGLFMLAEAEKPELMHNAFDMYYGWSLHRVMNNIAAGKANVDSLRANLRFGRERFPSSIRMNFTSNHDENSWNGTEFERMGPAAETFAALTYILPGMPLIYNGQEMGFNRRLEFFTKDTIEWGTPNRFTELYHGLNVLRASNPALYSGPHEDTDFAEVENSMPAKVFSCVRHRGDNVVVAVFNLSGERMNVVISGDIPAGEYTGPGSGVKTVLPPETALELGPWEYRIYHR